MTSIVSFYFDVDNNFHIIFGLLIECILGDLVTMDSHEQSEVTITLFFFNKMVIMNWFTN